MAALKRRGGDFEAVLLLASVVSTVTFAAMRPGVPDLWAAEARRYAAEHGAGLNYFLSWYDGTVPGHYSVALPYVARRLGTVVPLAVGATLAAGLLVQLTRRLSYARLTLAFGLVALACNVWSGRFAFVIGAAVALGCLLCVRERRPALAVVLSGVACLVTPLAGAFLAFGLTGVAWFDRDRRAIALGVMVTSGLCLIAIAHRFGSPGPEGFRGRDLIAALVGGGVLLMLRPDRRVALVVMLSLPVCLAVALIPNGLGSNFERMIWFGLPVAVVATARTKQVAVALVAAIPLGLGVAQTARDLRTAASPLSSAHLFDGLTTRLAQERKIANYRVEIVDNGTHTGAYALLGYARLARGYETQSDKGYDSVLERESLNAAAYRRWLDDNAVGFVVLTRRTLHAGPEDALVREHRPAYLRLIWSDHNVLLYAVERPTPIAQDPARVISVGEPSITVRTYRAGRFILRIRWSPHLKVSGGPGEAVLSEADGGWTRLQTSDRCKCVIDW